MIADDDPTIREALLRIADAVMREAQPAHSATFHVFSTAYRVRWEYPGRLVVSHRNDGAIVARSKWGRPTKLERERQARLPA